MAFALAVTGACAASAQGIHDKESSAQPPSGFGMRPAALPEARGGDTPRVVPLGRDGERASSEPGRPQAGDAALRGRLWAGTPYSLVIEALPRLPVRPASPLLRALTIEILTAPTEVVAGGRMAQRLAALRAERLYAMGQLEAAQAAFEAAALPAGDPAHGPAAFETKLLLAGHRAACPMVAEHLAVRSSAYLERASIACLAMAGEHVKAARALVWMRERGIGVGDVFATLVMAQQPELAWPVAALGRADAWTVSLLAETKLPLPDDAAHLDSPALLRIVAEGGKEPASVRVAAAERAFLMGAIDRKRLAAVYTEIRFREGALRQAARLPLAQYGPLHRALLFQAASLAPDRAAQVAILANWWRLARADHAEPFAALVTMPLIFDLLPGADWREHAGAISRVFFNAGELDRALDWYGWIRDATFKDMDSFIRLAALAQLAQRTGRGWSAGEANAWMAYQRDQASGAGLRRIALMQALEDGLGGRKPRDATVAGLGARATDDVLADWRDVRSAAHAGRRGEAILLMLTALGHDGIARAEPRALGAAVQALATLGRASEARRLAIEAALANGF